MKIILEDFNYKGMHFNKYELDLSELGDISDECSITKIFEVINEDLDKRLWKEVNTRT